MQEARVDRRDQLALPVRLVVEVWLLVLLCPQVQVQVRELELERALVLELVPEQMEALRASL